MFRTLCISASLFVASASVAAAQDSLSAGQYVRVYQKHAPAVEGTLLSIGAKDLLVAVSPTDTARIARKQVRIADVYRTTDSPARADAPGGSVPAEAQWIRVKVKQVRQGPAPSLGMHIMF